MEKFTIALYHYFRKHRLLFYSTVILSAVFFSYFSTKIVLEEDITKLLPSADEGGAEELVFSNLKVKDKIFILFHPKTDEVDTDALIDLCDNFVYSLLENDSTTQAIQNVLFQLDENLFMDAISFLYDHVPQYLTVSNYTGLDSLLTVSHIEQQMQENYDLLRSPAGMTYKDIIPRDPIALRNLFLSGMSGISSSLGGNYTLYNNHFFTADTTAAIAFVSPNFKAYDSKQGIKLAETIEKKIEIFEKEYPDIEILYHGAPVQSVYNSRQIKKDLLVTISISLLLIFIILLGCFKNKSTLVYLVLPVVYGVVFALAIIYFIKGSMSLMALGIGAIVMGVAFSYCMHVITHYKYVTDPVVVLKDQTVPVILGSLTTIGAFMGLLLTKSELLRDFGLFASLGLVGTTMFCLLFLPQFFRPERNRRSEKAFAALEKINSFSFEKQKWLIALIVVVSIVCFFASDRVKFDSDLRNIGYNEPDVMRSRAMVSNSATYETIYFASISADLDSALIYNRRLCDKLDMLVARNEVQGYSAPALLFVPTSEQEQRIAYWNTYWNAEKRTETEKRIVEAGAKFRFAAHSFAPFFDMLNEDYQPVSLYDSGVIPEEILSNIIEYTDNRYMVFTPVRMNRQDLLAVGGEVVSDNPNFVVIDPMYYTNNMVKVLHDDFSITLTISSLFVFIVLLVAYRNIFLTLIAFLPMGLSWYIVLGAMAIFGLEFNLINIVISTFIFGIGVDYSIFIMDGLLSKYRSEAPILVYHKTAIFFSAIILIIVTTSLLFAVHPAIASIGVATLIGMLSTILIAYTLLPFLFNLLVGYQERTGKVLVKLNK